MRGRVGRLAAAAAALGLALASAAGAEERSETSVGVAPISADVDVPREAALAAAVRAAALRVARGMLPDDFVPPGPRGRDAATPDAWLEAQLGDDPFAYATRFRILEDRGRRPAMFSEDPDVDSEYVVVAEVTVDVDTVRTRLESLGLLASGDGRPGRRVRIAIEGLDHYAPLALVRDLLLDDRRVRAAQPVEVRRGLAVLEVDGDRDAPGLVRELQRRAPPGLRIDPVRQSGDEATLRVEWTPPASPAPDADESDPD